MKKAYAQIADEAPYCWVCNRHNYEHSHNFPRSQFPYLIAEKQNITPLCRQHHLEYEDMTLEPYEAIRIINRMVKLAQEQENEGRKERMTQYIAERIVMGLRKHPDNEQYKHLYECL